MKRLLVFVGQAFLLASSLAQTSSSGASPQIGDVRLADGTAESGQVQIYLNDARGLNAAWGYVCGAEQVYAPNVICRQLGYTVALSSSYDAPTLSNRNWLTKLECTSNSPPHILRCKYRTGEVSCDGVLTVKCETTRIWQTLGPVAYNGQVQLCSRSVDAPSFGRVVLFGSDEAAWGTVNNRLGALYFSREDADTLCRQLGYTGSVPGSIQMANMTSECVGVSLKWDQSTSCREGLSYRCFGCCFTAPNPSTDPCSDCTDLNDVFVQCTFDVNLENPPGAGSKTDCSFSLGGTPSYGCDETSAASSQAILAFMLIFLFIAIGLGAAFLLLWYCTMYRRRKHRDYETIQ